MHMMKVTVCFADIRVVVPCADGSMTVRDLIHAAIVRYKKATAKPADSWVSVSSLQSLSDGGILDPDDQLVAVVDDKEQILAIFEEQDTPQTSVAEGRSLESSEWASHRGSGRNNASFRGSNRAPFLVNGESPIPAPRVPQHVHSTARDSPVENWVEVTDIDALPNSGLLVVRPFDNIAQINSNKPSPSSSDSHSRIANKTNETNNINPLMRQPSSTSQISHESDEFRPLPLLKPTNNNTPTTSDNVSNRFSRNYEARQSVVTNNFFEAYERVQSYKESSDNDDLSVCIGAETPSSSCSKSMVITVKGTPGEALAIQVAPDYGDRGRLNSIIVKQMHEGGRIAEDGQVKIEDKIVEINERPIYQMSFVRAQTYLHEASSEQEVSFKIIRQVKTAQTEVSPGDSGSVMTHSSSSTATAGMLPNAAPLQSSALQKANIKKIGQKMDIELTKGDAGLGFTVTSRDTAVDGQRPFYIKTVLPRGAAIEDGRLKSGDRLLEVAGKEVTGFTQKEVVDMLRKVPTGSQVMLVISRIDETNKSSSNSPVLSQKSEKKAATPTASDSKLLLTPSNAPSSLSARAISPTVTSPSLPRALPPEKAGAESLGSERIKRTYNFDIALNSSGCAGLGVSVKGRTAADSTNFDTQQDCGIFIKTVMHGGAAHKDGRLRVNDQLIAIDNVSLIGCTNLQAMQLISQTMQNLSPDAKNIQLKVLRVENSSYFSRQHESSGSSVDLGKNTGELVATSQDDSLSLDLDGGEMQRGSRVMVPESAPPPVPPRYMVPGYGDYAIVMKGASNKLTVPMHDNGNVMIADDDVYDDVRDVELAETASRVTDDDSSMVGGDAFVRDAPTRRSMSEKRHGPNAGNDPSNTLTYQRIKHQRQVSEKPERRSMSVESLTRNPANGHVNGRPPSLMVTQPMIHEIAIQKNEEHKKGGKKAGDRKRPTNDSFRQAVDKSYQTVPGMEVGVDVGAGAGAGQEGGPNKDVADNVHHHSLPRPNKDKTRRKSVGHIFSKGWLQRFGSGRSRDSSPEKESDKDNQEIKKRAYMAEADRIREQYEKLKKQQQCQFDQHMRISPHRVHSPKMPSHWVPPKGSPQPQPPPYGVARRYPPYNAAGMPAPMHQGPSNGAQSYGLPNGVTLHRTYMGAHGPVTISPGTYFNRGHHMEDYEDVPQSYTLSPYAAHNRDSASTLPYAGAWAVDGLPRRRAPHVYPQPRSVSPPGRSGASGRPAASRTGSNPRSCTVERAVSRRPPTEHTTDYPYHSDFHQLHASRNSKAMPVPVIPAPDYEQYLRKHKRKSRRPASNYCEYRCVNGNTDMQLTVAPALDNEPTVYSNPVYADTSNDSGFIVHM